MAKKSKKSGSACGCDCGGKRVNVGVNESVYGVGFIGAAVYFIKGAATFGAGAWGFGKALVWPAILVYELMKFLKL